MELVPSPYQPGTGAPPPVLAGRGDLFATVGARMLSVASYGRPAPSAIVLTGVRGMGKTVCLTRLREMAQEMGLGVASSRFARSGSNNMQALGEALARSGATWDDAPTAAWDRVKQHLKDFSVEINAGIVKLGTRVDELQPAPGSLTDVLADTAVTHLEHDRRGLALFVDELHTGSPEDLNTLAGAAQNLVADRALPVVIIAAGTPDTAGALERAGSSFAERFSYINVGPLSPEESVQALVQPSIALGVRWSPGATEEALTMAQGNPWRIQQLGDACWETAMQQGQPIVAGSQIDENLVRAAGRAVTTALVHGSFAGRWDNATRVERAYLAAAARSMNEQGVAETRHVDALMGRVSTQNSDVRATLINKGLITSPGRGAVTFSAPGFGEFILERLGLQRLDPDVLATRSLLASSTPGRTGSARNAVTARPQREAGRLRSRTQNSTGS